MPARLILVMAVGASVTSATGYAVRTRPMSFESCAKARVCTVRGLATYAIASHAPMARLDLPGGQCVSVSLPAAALADLRINGPRPLTVTGRVYGDPSGDREIAYMEIQGRKVGLGLCGDFLVFID